MATAPKTYRASPPGKPRVYKPKAKEPDAFYKSAKWLRLRKYVLSKSPVCATCGGIATHVDHITPRTKGGADYRLDNLQGLCHGCHSRKTRLEERE